MFLNLTNETEFLGKCLIVKTTFELLGIKWFIRGPVKYRQPQQEISKTTVFVHVNSSSTFHEKSFLDQPAAMILFAQCKISYPTPNSSLNFPKNCSTMVLFLGIKQEPAKWIVCMKNNWPYLCVYV